VDDIETWLPVSENDNYEVSNLGRVRRVAGVPVGERNGATKLTEQSVARVREMVRGGATQRAVALVFEVCQAQVSNIVTGKRRVRIA
jgi:hypothetical protein